MLTAQLLRSVKKPTRPTFLLVEFYSITTYHGHTGSIYCHSLLLLSSLELWVTLHWDFLESHFEILLCLCPFASQYLSYEITILLLTLWVLCFKRCEKFRVRWSADSKPGKTSLKFSKSYESAWNMFVKFCVYTPKYLQVCKKKRKKKTESRLGVFAANVQVQVKGSDCSLKCSKSSVCFWDYFEKCMKFQTSYQCLLWIAMLYEPHQWKRVRRFLTR